MIFSCTRSNNKQQIYYLLKKWNTPSPHKACVLLFPILLFFWQLNQCSYHFFGGGSCSCYVTQLLILRHVAVLLVSCLLYKFCKVLSICRRILELKNNFIGPARSGTISDHQRPPQGPPRCLQESLEEGAPKRIVFLFFFWPPLRELWGSLGISANFWESPMCIDSNNTWSAI